VWNSLPPAVRDKSIAERFRLETESSSLPTTTSAIRRHNPQRVLYIQPSAAAFRRLPELRSATLPT